MLFNSIIHTVQVLASSQTKTDNPDAKTSESRKPTNDVINSRTPTIMVDSNDRESALYTYN